MEEPETIEPEYFEIKKEYEIKLDDNKIRIEMNNNEIIFTLIIDLSFNKNIKRFKIDEFKKKFEIDEEKILTNEEMIKELISEIKNIKKEKNELEKQIYELDNIFNKDKYKNEIN